MQSLCKCNVPPAWSCSGDDASATASSLPPQRHRRRLSSPRRLSVAPRPALCKWPSALQRPQSEPFDCHKGEASCHADGGAAATGGAFSFGKQKDSYAKSRRSW
eukprot:GHVT01102900.1.p1 GENE.GHVT01102900.1~~GHVT01102900.1.p1  ORF type:complete len:104 (+),score=20.25 GHVT01102900.1:192-503(+)